MAELKPYVPDLDKISFQLQDKNPKVLNRHEYQSILERRELTPGADLSDEEILIAMEEGLIKVWDPENNFVLEKQMQGASLDLRLGKHFWYYKQHEVSRLTLGKHLEAIRDIGLLSYVYKETGEDFIFHPGTLVLALTQEHISISNAAIGVLNGRSSAARLGLGNHQTSDVFEPTFHGPLLMEFANANFIDVAAPSNIAIANISFRLLGRPSTRPRIYKTETLSHATGQKSPFGFWLPEWDKIQKRTIAKLNKNRQHRLSGNPSQE